MERLDHFVVEENEVLVFGMVKSGVFDVADQIV